MSGSWLANHAQVGHRIFRHKIFLKKLRISARRMGKYEAEEVKELSEYVKANKKRHKTQHEEIKAAKTVTEKIQKVGEL